ncbi:ABC transporter substrate-binding protein [Pseudomonas sp. H2_E05]
MLKRLLEGAKTVLKEHGLEHVGNSYHSLQEQEFSGYLTNAAISTRPDVLVLLNLGSQSSNTLRQAVNFGIKERMKVLVRGPPGLTTEELGSDVLEAGSTPARSTGTRSTTPVRRAGQADESQHGYINPTYPLAADYISTKVMLDSIIATGSFDGPTVAKAMQGLELRGPDRRGAYPLQRPPGDQGLLPADRQSHG